MKQFGLALLTGLLLSTDASAQTPTRYPSLPSNGDQGGVLPGRKPSGTDPKPSESGMTCDGEFCSSTALETGLRRPTNPQPEGGAQPNTATEE